MLNTEKFHHVTPPLTYLRWLKLTEYRPIKYIPSNKRIYLRNLLTFQTASILGHSCSVITLICHYNFSGLKMSNRSIFHSAPALRNSLYQRNYVPVTLLIPSLSTPFHFINYLLLDFTILLPFIPSWSNFCYPDCFPVTGPGFDHVTHCHFVHHSSSSHSLPPVLRTAFFGVAIISWHGHVQLPPTHETSLTRFIFQFSPSHVISFLSFSRVIVFCEKIADAVATSAVF
jgi:hypothetical protein